MSVNILDSALHFAKYGWPVFPCSPSGAQPLTGHGFRDATTDEEQIRAWWKRYPSAMIGVPTGSPSRMWVLDVDMKNGKDGKQTLASLEAANGPLPLTVRSCTPSGGGCHNFFRLNGLDIRNSVNQIGPGLDTRGEGGYVVVPPSVRADGNAYTWAPGSPDQLADAPPWLLAMVMRAPC